MKQTSIPEGYGLAQLEDKRWYPLQVHHLYGVIYPEEGTVSVSTIIGEERDISFPQRKDALAYCQHHAQEEAAYQQRKWEALVSNSDVYPERCCWYLDLIEQITGRPPYVKRWYWGGISVRAWGYACPCGAHHSEVGIHEARTMEEALESVANMVYAIAASCPSCTQESRECTGVA